MCITNDRERERICLTRWLRRRHLIKDANIYPTKEAASDPRDRRIDTSAHNSGGRETEIRDAWNTRKARGRYEERNVGV